MWPRATVGGFSPHTLRPNQAPNQERSSGPGWISAGSSASCALPQNDVDGDWASGSAVVESYKLRDSVSLGLDSLPHPTSLWEDFAWKLRLGEDSM